MRRNLRVSLLIFICAVLSACSTGPKRLDGQGREGLEKICDKGTTGACALVGRPVEFVKPIPILQSITSSGQSRFVIVIPRRERLSYYLRTSDGDFRALTTVEHFERSGQSATVDQVEAFDLKPELSYELIVVDSDGMLWDKRGFHSLDLNKPRARFAVTSCMDDAYQDEQKKMWPQLIAQRPDVLFMIGDNVYADQGADTLAVATPDQLWRRYVETRDRLLIFKANPLIPTVAVWDDNDYGKNDSDRTYPYKNESTDIFFTFFAQRRPAPEFSRGPGVGSWWNAFDVHFAFLDDRSFRSPDGLDLPDQTHFGADQEKWLSDQLGGVAGETTFLISGDQFFGGYHRFESYEGSHPKRFKQQLEEWRKIKAPLVFISGDRHLSEIIKVPPPRLGYPTFELTSSAIHAHVYPDAFERDPDPNQLAGVAGKQNYMIVELLRSERGFLQLEVEAFGLDKKQLYQKTLTVKRL